MVNRRLKILYVIDSLRLGGTENQLLAQLPALSREHEIILVTLKADDRPGLGELPVARRYSLGLRRHRGLLGAVRKLKRIIAAEKPDLVRSQLYWSSIAARLATPKSIPLIFSLHSTLSADGYSKSKTLLWLEKLTYGPHHMVVGVSNHVLADFDKHIGIKGPAEVLINFVRPEFVGPTRNGRGYGRRLRLVAVGNLKPVKNYGYLIEALKELPRDIELDIYGEGAERAALERQIAAAGVNVRLMGVRDDIWNVLPDYDLFVMPSHYEGCPNAALEAMAVGLPALLSDIPVMHEVSRGNALFFDPKDPAAFVDLITRVQGGEIDLEAVAAKGMELVRANHVKERYLERLNELYAGMVAQSARPAEGRTR
jgi:glycosyltransferase involved in cell wall biosynthesis